MNQPERSGHFLRPRPLDKPRARLFTFPYAGGAAVAFHSWAAAAPPGVEVVALQYPGRGRLTNMSPCTNLADILDEVSATLRSFVDVPYYFFGHSMGATVSYELARRLQAASGSTPRALFLSARAAPNSGRPRNSWHLLPEDAFLQRVLAFGGMRPEILQSPEMLKFVLAIVRADLTALDTWTYEEGQPLKNPIVALGGDRDPDVNVHDLEGWRAHTSGHFERHIMSGGHFYIQDHLTQIMKIIGRVIEADLAQAPLGQPV